MKISVVTAVFNRRATVSDALDSVLAQTWPDVEPVVIDGGSTDGTVEVIAQYGRRITTFVSEPDGGIYHALNKGVRRATGDVVGFLHADDVFADDGALEHVARAFEDPAVEVVYGDLVYVRESDPRRVVRVWRAGEFSPAKLSWGWMPPHPTVYARRRVYDTVGLFDTTEYRIAGDYDWLLRCLGTAGLRPAYIPHVLVRMRTGGVSNGSLRSIVRKSSEDYRALRRNRIGGVAALAWKNFSKLPQWAAKRKQKHIG